MNKNEFFESVKDAVLAKIKVEDATLDATISEVTKANGIMYHGMSFRGKKNIQPVIYLDEFYSKYSEGLCIEVIVDTVTNIYLNSRKNDDIDVSLLSSYERAKGNITVALMNAELNRKMLEDMPHRIYEDLAMYYKVDLVLPDSLDGGTVKVTNAILETWKVSEKELYDAAIKNTLNTHKPVCKDMFSVISSMMDDDTEFDEDMKNSGMLVLSTEEKTLGAVYMLPELGQLSKIADSVEDNLIVLPSSKHEVILLRAAMADKNGLDFFKNMVSEVNETQVSREDFLSNNVYVYNRNNNTLKVA